MRSSKFDIEFDAEVDEIKKHLRCIGSHSEGSPDVMYLPNGDPGYPGDSAEVNLKEMWINGKKISEEMIDDMMDFDQFRIILEDKVGEYMSDKMDYLEPMEDK